MMGTSEIRGAWVQMILAFLTMNVALLSVYLFGNKGFSWRTRQQEGKEQEAGLLCSESKNMGSLELDPRICSGRNNRCAQENGNHDAGHQARLPKDSIINLDHGDPTMFEAFWKKAGDKSSLFIPGWQTMSYFSDVTNLCWFLEPEFADEVRKMHRLVGNANVDGYHIVVGTGSTQLYQAALYALSRHDAPEPMNVVCAVPFYSSYPLVTSFLKSGLYRWAGDAFDYDLDAPYIEVVTSPNNPDGHIKEPVVLRAGGKLIHDLAYYWPQYTPISKPADHDLMLFTVSKSTGHAGTRIGWALVKDATVASKMAKFIEINTIGVSKDSQLRAAKILHAVRVGYDGGSYKNEQRFFDFGRKHMTQRWERLRDAVKKGNFFSLPDYPKSFCNFMKEPSTIHPPFAWLKCERGMDCESCLREQKILVRGGKHFGVGPEYVRVSMLDKDDTFDLLIERLSKMH